MIPEAGGWGPAVRELQRADDPCHSLVAWGSGPSSLHLPLLQPVLSSLPAQRGGAQSAGTPSHASSGLFVVGMATVRSLLCIPFPYHCFLRPGLS